MRGGECVKGGSGGETFLDWKSAGAASTDKLRMAFDGMVVRDVSSGCPQPYKKTGAVFGKVPDTAPVCVGLTSRMFLSLFGGNSALFSDSCLLARKFAQVVQFSAANLTDFVNGNAVDVRTVDGEDTLYAYRTRHFANGETFVVTVTGNFDNNTPVQLDTLLVTFDDFVCYGYGISGLECRERLTGSKSFFCDFN